MMDISQSQKKFMLTQEGLEDLRREYEKLVKIKRPQVIQRIQRAREFGDLSENSEYDAAKDEQSLLELRITELEEVLNKTQIIEKASKSGFVVIGSTVVVEVDGEKDEFMIVGTIEANPAKRKIKRQAENIRIVN